MTYNTLDNNKHPTGGMLLSFGQDFAGLGGDVAYMRTVADFRTYYEVVSDLVGVLHLQGGNMIGLSGPEPCGCSTTSRWGRIWCADSSPRASVRET